MNEQEQNNTYQPADQEPEPAPRPWVTPTFERVELEKALTSAPNISSFDGTFYYS